MGPRDRDDILRLVNHIQAIEQTDRGKAPICLELREKLQRCLTIGWLPEPGAHARQSFNVAYPHART